uniref:Uncharacterized protein n=1 Tax=Lygus hesperus TaxID=30085 RepID=A0A0A9VQC3_LYGHE
MMMTTRYFASLLQERVNPPEAVIDWLMMPAVATLTPPSVKKVLMNQLQALYGHSFPGPPAWSTLRRIIHDVYIILRGPAMGWNDFLNGFSQASGNSSSALSRTTIRPTTTTVTSSTIAVGTDDRDGADAAGCAPSSGQRVPGVSSSTQTEITSSTNVYCTIFSRGPGGSSYRRPIQLSGSTYVNIQNGKLNQLQDRDTREWWRHVDLNAWLLLDLMDQDNHLSWRIQCLLTHLQEVEQRQQNW